MFYKPLIDTFLCFFSGEWLLGNSHSVLKCWRCSHYISVGCWSKVLHSSHNTRRFIASSGKIW